MLVDEKQTKMIYFMLQDMPILKKGNIIYS